MADTPYRIGGTISAPLTAGGIAQINDEIEKLFRLIRSGSTGGSSSAATLGPTGVTPGSYGTASRSITEVVQADGRLTSISDQAIAIDGSQITTGTVPTARLPTTIGTTCSLYNSTAQTLTSGTELALSFDSEDYDASNMHSPITNPTRITIPTGLAGVYTFTGRTKFTSAFAGTIHVRLYQNGSLVTENTAAGSDLSSGNEYHQVSADINCAVGDYIECKVLVELAAGSGTIATASGTGNTQFQAKQAIVTTGVTAGNKVVQVVNTETGTFATGTTQIPSTNAIPTNTEGDQYMSLTITPTSATNKLKIEVVAMLSPSVASWMTGALFQDSTTNALAAMMNFQTTALTAADIHFTHYMAAGTTSATTFKVRAGMDRTGTTTFNGNNGAQLMGGVMASSITITEIIP